MKNSPFFKHILWDSATFGIETFEIISLSKQALMQAVQNPGHYTAKVDPLASKEILHEYGFYYCDTLIEPYCRIEQFVYFDDKKATMTKAQSLKNVTFISQNAFSHGRFHRDFNFQKDLAENRYLGWLKQLYNSNCVYELSYDSEVAGFIAIDKGKLVLHALVEKFRGKGISKFLWSKVCRELFDNNLTELTSSISASNLATLNLYSSLGFRFRNAFDIYHRLVE